MRSRNPIFALLALALAAGCGKARLKTAPARIAAGPEVSTEEPGTGGVVEESGTLPVDACLSESKAAKAPLQRLSKTMYVNTLAALLGPEVTAVAADEIATLPGEEGEAFSSHVVPIADAHVEAYGRVARVASAYAVSTDAVREKYAACFDAAPGDACVEETLRTIGTAAFRHAPTDAELELLRAAYAIDGLRAVWQAALQAPAFLFLLPQESNVLSPQELAVKISYALWQAPPDADLNAAAANGGLATQEGVAQQVRRMLADARSRDNLRRFYRDWLRLEELAVPSFSDEFLNGIEARGLLPEMRFELEEFTVDAARYDELMTSTRAFVRSDALAAIYNVSPNAMAAVSLPANERAGLLTRAAFVATGSDERDPFKLAKKIRTQILCQELPPPPQNIAPAMPGPLEEGLSQRQRLEHQTSAPACQGCHSQLQIGFTLGNYDGVGRYQLTDHAQPIDARVGDVTGGLELSRWVAGDAQARQCFVKQLWRFAAGRHEAPEDECLLARATARLSAADGGIQAALQALVTDPAFRLRRGD